MKKIRFFANPLSKEVLASILAVLDYLPKCKRILGHVFTAHFLDIFQKIVLY